MKKIKRSYIIAFFTIMLYIIFSAMNNSFAGVLTYDIDGIDENRYPGIKNLIYNARNTYGNSTFQVYYTGIDWTEAVTMEYQGHGKSPKNLFSVGDKYKGKWYCPICGSRTYDTGWYCASVEAIEYMMDPRNSMTGNSIFQFKNLAVCDVSSNDISAVINNKYASRGYLNNPTTINAIANASAQNSLNGYSILAKIVNEQGNGTSPLISGAGYNGRHAGYYNFFNVGAYGNGTANVIENGLAYAESHGWNSINASICGGSEFYKNSYIGKGQNTLYYQRFNVIYANALFSHQYQQNIMAAESSAGDLSRYYSISGAGTSHNFVIPLYENMPRTACSRPSTSENSVLQYEDTTVVINGLAVKASPNSGRIISYLNSGEKIKVLKRASNVSGDGKYWDTILTSFDGTYGYVDRSGIGQPITFPKYVFDYKYYADNNADLKATFGYNEFKLAEHYKYFGIKEGRSASPAFDVKYYLRYNGDLQAAFGNNYEVAYNHFLVCGINEGRRSSIKYDPVFYKYYNGDLINLTYINLINHYVMFGVNENRISALDPEIESIVFDYNTYKECNYDLQVAFGNDYAKYKQHWICCGINEGRIASLLYDPKVYLNVNNDLRIAFGNNYRAAFVHFIGCGINESRMTSLFFDIKTYIKENSDMTIVFGKNYKKIYNHFVFFGINEGRNASEIMEVKTYLRENGDLKLAFGTNYKKAFMHFLFCGINESRRTSTKFDVNVYKNRYMDLKNAYGNNCKDYYWHYIICGKNERRSGV